MVANFMNGKLSSASEWIVILLGSFILIVCAVYYYLELLGAS